MSQPPDKYERIFDFTDFSATQPSAQQPGQKIDQELNAARESLNDTIDRLNEIQRDDGKLRATAVDTSEFQGIVDAATATATAAAASAATSATTATTKAGEATASATTASNAATTATGASASAQAQATIASTSATTATTKATEASNSAASALASQTSATASAATATTKAAEAAGSAATAATQAGNAANSANTSAAQASLATASAVAAGNSASTASAQAIAASNSASAASASASAAASSAASFGLGVGSVASGAPGSTPVVTVTGSSPSYLLNFTLPASDPVTAATITSALGYTPGNPANYALLAGATFTGLVSTPASATGGSGFRVVPGVAPTSPTNGDVWNNGVDLQVRLNGVTETVAEQSWVNSRGFAPLASPSLTGTPLSPTTSVNVNSQQIANTAFVRDMLSDCTWSAPPISTTTTAQSGTGASYVNLPPDTGYLIGPNANIAGYIQKGMHMFARSSSSYGFNYTKEMRIACKMAINWSSTFTGINYTLIQRLGNTGTGALAAVGFGISINMATKVLSILAHNGTTLTTKATSWAVPFAGIASVDFMVKSDGTGTVFAYADGVLIDSTTGMATTTSSANTSMYAAVEIISAGGTSTGGATGYISNLRTFVAHG